MPGEDFLDKGELVVFMPCLQAPYMEVISSTYLLDVPAGIRIGIHVYACNM